MPDAVFVIILAAIMVQRLVESFLPNCRKMPGAQVARWTWAAFCVTYPLLLIGVTAEHFLVRRELDPSVMALGLFIVAARIWLKWWAMRSLWRFWSVHIEIRDSHELVTTGPYRYLRHPAYLSNLMEYIGVALFANAYCTLIGVIVIYLPLNLTRLRLEERELVKKFGDEYRQYRARVHALVPFPRRRR